MIKQNLFPLPTNWHWARLGDVLTLINGRAYKQDELLDSGPTPIIRIQNLNKGKNWYYSDLELPAEKYCSQGDLLYAWSATFGPYIWNGPKAIYHYHIWKVATSDSLDKTYAYYLLDWMSDNVRAHAHGVTMVHMTKQGMEDSKIPLPPLPEQQCIAALLEKVDHLRSLRRQSLKRLDDLVQATFLEMFGDPVTNPMGWEISNLQNGIDFLTSGSRGWAQFYSQSGRKFIRIQNVKNGILNFDDVQYVQAPESMESERTKVKENDLLISITADLGRTAVVDKQTADHGAHINQHLALIRLKQNWNARFISSLVESELGKQAFKRLDQSAVKSGLNFNAIKSVPVILPPYKMQKEYEIRFEQITAQKSKLKNHLIQLDTLFNTLMHQAFNGELNWKEVEQAVIAGQLELPLGV